MKKTLKVVLSGSGLLYPLHAGAMHRISETHEIEAICGVSGGSIVGAMYASGWDPREVKQIIMETLPGENLRLIDPSLAPWWSWGLIKGNKFLQAFKDFYPERIGDVKIPLKVGAVNIDRREHRLFCSESDPEANLPLAVRASMCFPGAFVPVKIDGDRYVDGGVAGSFPLDVYGQGEDVLGLKVVTKFDRNTSKPRTLADYIFATVDTMRSSLDREHMDDALHARFIRLNTDSSAFNLLMKQWEAEKLYEEGYQAADAWFNSQKATQSTE